MEGVAFLGSKEVFGHKSTAKIESYTNKKVIDVTENKKNSKKLYATTTH